MQVLVIDDLQKKLDKQFNKFINVSINGFEASIMPPKDSIPKLKHVYYDKIKDEFNILIIVRKDSYSNPFSKDFIPHNLYDNDEFKILIIEESSSNLGNIHDNYVHYLPDGKDEMLSIRILKVKELNKHRGKINESLQKLTKNNSTGKILHNKFEINFVYYQKSLIAFLKDLINSEIQKLTTV